MDILGGIHTRRSIRTYLDQPVPEELVQKLLAAAMQAPAPAISNPGNSSSSTTGRSWRRFRRSCPTLPWPGRLRWRSWSAET